MLTSLYIENVAVIEKTEIELFDGLNILTGETGAGKSIFIDAINTVMGQRTSKEIIRNGAESATVYATFSNVNEVVNNTLEENGYEIEDELIISRTLSLSGKSACRINGKPATTTFIKQLALNLINIHGQHESYQLFSPETHIMYIDNMANNADLRNKYSNAYKEYKVLSKQLKEFELADNNREQKIDILSYQVNELENACLEVGEIEQLQEERTILANSEKISDCLKLSKRYLSGNNNSGVIDNIDECMTALIKATNYNPQLESLSNRISDVYYELQDINNILEDEIDTCEYNPYRLEEIDDRLSLLKKLSKKYGDTVEEMQKFLENAKAELETLLQYDTNRSELIKKCSIAKEKAKQIADELTKSRIETGEIFKNKVKEEMVFLNMPRVELAIDHSVDALTENGQDVMEILISANPGETPKPVAKIASGGELSRMMLAIKTVLASSDVIDTLIFDEVDTGVSGSAAQKVGLKLKEVSKSRQVLCVTHQAQIAALADNHFLISKEVLDDRTYTKISKLDYDGRLNELARILDGVNITQTALAHAKQLLNNGE